MSAGMDTIEIQHIPHELAIGDLEHPAWFSASETLITKYWSGDEAPSERHIKTRLLWSQTALYVRFQAGQQEPLVVNADPDLTSKTIGLWERDVCEIFIAADPDQPTKYLEFEVAPTGEWLDLSIELRAGERITDWEYSSQMQTAAQIRDSSVVMAINVPFASLATPPRAGDIWLGNIFRCVGTGPARGYLAWQPTESEEPNFHVPAKFGQLKFI
jgi:alpha-galactosidase